MRRPVSGDAGPRSGRLWSELAAVSFFLGGFAMTDPEYRLFRKIKRKGKLSLDQMLADNPFEDEDDLNTYLSEAISSRLLYRQNDNDPFYRMSGKGEEALRMEKRDRRNDRFSWISLFLSIASVILAFLALVL